MKMEMTARDKKLLIMLSIFVIVVCIGYWGIIPIIKDMKQIKEDIVVEEEKRDLNEMKLIQLPMLQMDNEELEENIVKAKEDYFPVMTSDEIDKYFTTMALDYNLYAYSLDISMPNEQANRQAYQFSEKYQEDQNVAASAIDTSLEESSSVTSDLDQVDSTAALFTEDTTDSSQTGIYEAAVRMKLGGDEKDLRKLINDLSDTNEKLLLTAYSWDSNREIITDEENSLAVSITKTLNVSISFFMCEE